MRKQLGFTLIELLIVMVIIGIVAGIATFTISSNQHKQFGNIANQLANTILLAEQEAMLKPAVIGLDIGDHTLQFYIVKRDKKTNHTSWIPFTSISIKTPTLPNNIQMTLKINDEVITANGNPKLIMTPSNDLTPFVIFIGKKDETPYYQIRGKANGEVTSEPFQTQ